MINKFCKQHWPILSLVILALLLRLPLLNGSFWLDEAAQVLESSRSFTEQINIVDDFQPPLLHFLTFFSLRLANLLSMSGSEAWLRLWGALLPGLITIVYTYLVANKLFNKRSALLASLFLATSSFHIFFSQELRPYSLPACFAVLSTYYLLVIDEKREASWLFILFSILGLYSSYLYPFLLLAQFFYLLKFYQILVEPKMLKKLLPYGLIVLAYLPWLPYFFAQLQAGQALRQNFLGWEQVVGSPQLKNFLLVPAKFLFGVSDLKFNLYYVATSLALLSLVYKLWQQKFFKLRKSNAFLFTAYLLLFPLLTVWLSSFITPILQAKRVLYLLPFFYILLAALIAYPSSKVPTKSKIATALIALLMMINSYSLVSYWTKASLQRENWRSLIAEINQKFPSNNTIALFAFPAPFAPWNYYQSPSFPTLSSGNYDLRQLANPQEYFKVVSNYDYVLIFDYLRELTDPADQLPDLVQNLGYAPAGVLDYPGIGFVRIYINNHSLNLAENNR